MTRVTFAICALVLTAAAAAVQAQSMASPDGAKTLAATMHVYVFPSEGQSSEVQSKQESECYSWAVETTGLDPFELSKQAEQSAAQATAQQGAVAQQGKGSAARGALIGAAGGALIGEIASNDPGKGAAWGAAAGAIGGRVQRKKSQAAAQQQIAAQNQSVQQATAEQTANFKKAFAACLEAKDYVVKF